MHPVSQVYTSATSSWPSTQLSTDVTFTVASNRASTSTATSLVYTISTTTDATQSKPKVVIMSEGTNQLNNPQINSSTEKLGPLSSLLTESKGKRKEQLVAQQATLIKQPAGDFKRYSDRSYPEKTNCTAELNVATSEKGNESNIAMHVRKRNSSFPYAQQVKFIYLNQIRLD